MITIIIRREGDTWAAETNDPSVVRLFGTNTLPTPYGARTPATVVLQRLRHLNPGALVVAEA